MSPSLAPTLGRYTLFDELASGGFARVHLGRLNGDAGFARLVAIKRLHEGLAADPDAVRLLLDEARLASRVRHPNVVQTLDVLAADGELWLVMDYVHGETLARLLGGARRRGASVPWPVLGAMMSNALSGLHAAHETVDETGQQLGIVHRDVSPQNIIVGVDGVARVLDFGIAKANGLEARTQEGQFRGKLAYAAPEQMDGGKRVDRAVDVYAAGVVLWEALVGRRLFLGSTEPEIIMRVALGKIERPTVVNPAVPPAAEAVVMRALAREPSARYPTALAMAHAVEQALGVAPTRDVGAWVAGEAASALARSAALIAKVEQASAPWARGDAASLPEPLPPRASPGPVPPPARSSFPAPPPARPSFPAPPPARSSFPTPPPAQPLFDQGPAEARAAGTFAERVYTRSAQHTLPPAPPSRWRLAAMALLLVGGVMVATVTLVRRAPVLASAPAASTVRLEAAALPSVAPAEPVALAPSVPLVAPSPPPSSPPAIASTPLRSKPAAAARPAPRPDAAPANAPGCSPPYTVDANGRRRFKPECL